MISTHIAIYDVIDKLFGHRTTLGQCAVEEVEWIR